MQGILTSSTIAKCLEKIYDDPENLLFGQKYFYQIRGLNLMANVKKY
jgi:hypothetical protein